MKKVFTTETQSSQSYTEIFSVLLSVLRASVVILFFFFFLSSSFAQITFRNTFGGTANDEGRSVKQTFDGGYIIAGSTSSFGNGNSDAYVIKLDSLGMKQWSICLNLLYPN